MEGGLVRVLVFLSLPLGLIALSSIICLVIDWDPVSAWASVYLQISVLTAIYAWKDAQFIVFDESWSLGTPSSFTNLVEDQKSLYIEFFKVAPVYLITFSILYGSLFLICQVCRYGRFVMS
jgi:hypothetical protein